MTENIYNKHLFFTQSQSKIQQNCPFGILIGSEGTGKTTLFNKLANKSYIDQNTEFSEAKHCFSTLSDYQNKFRIIDSLGTCENIKQMNALSLKLASIEGPINRIFLLIKYERLGPMQKKFSEQMFYLQDWKNFITIVITNWDREDTPENRNTYEAIKAQLTSDADQEYPFIFVGKEPNNQQLCKVFYNNLCQNDPNELEIDCDQLNFSLNENINLFINQQKERFEEISHSVLKKIFKHNQNDKKKSFEDFILNISLESQDLINNFYFKYGKEATQIEINLYYLKIKTYLIQYFDNAYTPQNQSFNQLETIKNNKKCFLTQIWIKMKQIFCG